MLTILYIFKVGGNEELLHNFSLDLVEAERCC